MKSHPRLLLSVGVVAAVLICCTPSPLYAIDKFWIDSAGGSFSDVANWDDTQDGPGGDPVPGAADIANFTLNNTYEVDLFAAVTNTRLDVENGNVTFDVVTSPYSLTSTSAALIGNIPGQTGRLTVRRGTLAVDTNGNDMIIGQSEGGTGFLTVTTGGRIGDGTIRPDIFVGSAGTGTLTVNDDGRIDGTVFRIGEASGSTGTATITGPNAVADFSSITLVGSGGTGIVLVTDGGTLTSAGTVTLGDAATGVGTATVTGTNSRWNLSGTQTIGSFGLGVMTVSSGGLVVSNSRAILGSEVGSEGRVTVSGPGSQWTLDNMLTIGNRDKGDLLVSGGGEVFASGLVLANSSVANGVVTVTGAGSKLAISENVTVGSVGAGTLNVASGGEVYAGHLFVDNAAGAPIGTLNLNGGSIFVTGDFANSGVFNFTDGLLQVARNFQPNAAAAPLVINGGDNDDLPTLDRIGFGLTTNVTAITVGNNRRGQLLLRQGGGFNVGGNSINIGAVVGGEGTVSVQSGAQLLTTGPLAVGGTGFTAGGTGTLDISGGTVDVGTVRLFSGSTINLSGGTFAVNTVPMLDGQFNWTGGTLRFDADFSLTSANVPKLLGLDATLGPGQALTSAAGQTVTLQTPLIVDGGSLSASALINQSRLEVRSGSIGAVQNDGLITGDGTIAGALNNNSTGRIRVDAGKSLFFTFALNNGELNLVGGTLDFTSAVTNTAAGRINGRGTLDFNGGLTNAGKMQFSGGPTDIFGNVTFTGGAGGGEMINSGGGNVVTFYDNVTHNGDEIRTSPTNTTVFFGNVTGAGPFTGTGAVQFEGTFMPGNSPAAVTFEGDLALGSDAILSMELGGTNVGSQYDQVDAAGSLSIDGTLEVTLLDGFAPRYGDAFDLLDYGTLAGRFDTLNLPVLGAGLVWDTSALYSTGAITAVPEPAGWILAATAGVILMQARRRRAQCSC